MGQQGKFLLNKVGYSMTWKHNILNNYDHKNIFFKSLLVSHLLTFLTKNSIFILFWNQNKNYLKNFINDPEQEIFLKRRELRLKKTSKKFYNSQITIIYFNSWYLIKIYSYCTKKNILKFRFELAQESFFRYKFQYIIMSANKNKF